MDFASMEQEPSQQTASALKCHASALITCPTRQIAGEAWMQEASPPPSVSCRWWRVEQLEQQAHELKCPSGRASSSASSEAFPLMEEQLGSALIHHRRGHPHLHRWNPLG